MSGLLFGFFAPLLIFPIYRSFFTSLIVSLVIGLSFGLSILLANLIHIKRIERKYGKSPEFLKSHQTKELELPIPYDKAFDLCLEAVKSFKRVEIKEMNKHLGRIVALKQTKIPLDWHRDIITIKLIHVDNNRTHIRISSKPFPDPPSEYYVDYGSNLENVNMILEYLNDQLKKRN